MTTTHVLSLLRDPPSVAAWGVPEWADTLPRLLQAGMASTVAARLNVVAGSPPTSLPAGVRRQLLAATVASDAELRSLSWELGEVAMALRGLGIVAVPLKGADYLLRRARPARGRKVADLDLLVAPDDLDRATAALRAARWEFSEVPKGWTREQNIHLPTMLHTLRQTQLEIHYQLVGEGGAVHFDVASVIAAATPLPDGVLALLQPEDTTLVCVAHFIRNVRAFSAFRDLLDLRELVVDFTAIDPNFGNVLTKRAEAVGLGPALSRAVRDTVTLFGPTASPELDAWARRRKPSLAGGSAMALVPDGASRPSFMTRLHRVGRMFARMRSSHSRWGTVKAGLALLFPKDAANG